MFLLNQEVTLWLASSKNVCRKDVIMLQNHLKRLGNFTWGLGALLLGLPLPFVLLAFLFGGCK
jgi:hypothetical protein